VNIAELKNDLHRMIVETDDEAILEQISKMFELLLGEKNAWESLSEAERQNIENGLEDFRQSRLSAHSEVREKVQKLLSN
jgi:uncharacterized protein YbaP (TraB family)